MATSKAILAALPSQDCSSKALRGAACSGCHREPPARRCHVYAEIQGDESLRAHPIIAAYQRSERGFLPPIEGRECQILVCEGLFRSADLQSGTRYHAQPSRGRSRARLFPSSGCRGIGNTFRCRLQELHSGLLAGMRWGCPKGKSISTKACMPVEVEFRVNDYSRDRG